MRSIKYFLEEVKIMRKINCYFCRSEVIWVEEQDKENYGYVGDGIVVHLNCKVCSADVLFIENRE
tara:strand:- start:8073 stop:8267 length:195 start_codon:yes stop_codon:yes gene_type:complete